MKKQKYYLDTSIFNFILTDKDTARRDITAEVIKRISQESELFISEIVLAEIDRSQEPKRSELANLVKKIAPGILVIDDETETLAIKYIQAGIIPEKYRDDAFHIASAVTNEIDIILSWNFEHIVKLKTRREVNGLNMISGYRLVEICSPEEVYND